MNRIKEILNTSNTEMLSRTLEDLEFEFYTDELVNRSVDFEFGIEKYDLLMSALGYPDNSAPLIREMVDRNRFMDDLQIFSTKIDNLYFVRMEQYGYADEDAVIYRLLFSYNIEDEIQNLLLYMSERDFIKTRNQKCQ